MVVATAKIGKIRRQPSGPARTRVTRNVTVIMPTVIPILPRAKMPSAVPCFDLGYQDDT